MKLNKTCNYRLQPDLLCDDLSNNYLHFFMEDLLNSAFPYRQNNQNAIATLKNEDKTILNLFTKEKDTSSINKIDMFFRDGFKDLIYYKKIAFEIHKDIKCNSEIIPFPANSIRYSILRGQYYQKLPKDSSAFYEKPCDTSNRLYFNKEDFFIINTPKIFLKRFPSFINRSQLASNINPFLDPFNVNTKNKLNKKQLFEYRIFSNIGKNRSSNSKFVTEYYDLYCHLKFSKFVAQAREEFLDQMNDFLSAICKKLNLPENEFILNGVVSSADYEEIEQKLRNNEITFKEAWNYVFNK